MKMWISTSRSIGMERGAKALMAEAEEIVEFMNRLAKEESDYVKD